MTDGPFVCIDPIVPLELSTLAADRAVAVRPDNDGSNLHAAGDRLRFWGDRHGPAGPLPRHP